VLSNHDLSRHVSRYLRRVGNPDPPIRDALARAAATIVLTLRGTPFLYPADGRVRNVARQRADPHSVLSHYRRFLRLRRRSAALRSGDMRLIDVRDRDVVAYVRRAEGEMVLVLVRFDLRGRRVRLPPLATEWEVVLSSHPIAARPMGGRYDLRRLEAVILRPG
jgi:trehalose-6-phosphate hydrolase